MTNPFVTVCTIDEDASTRLSDLQVACKVLPCGWIARGSPATGMSSVYVSSIRQQARAKDTDPIFTIERVRKQNRRKEPENKTMHKMKIVMKIEKYVTEHKSVSKRA
ncbi:hypothetical protein M8J77_011921 [Diaphorina citri]|nr:hypothetical protein M8J77_011921 [Diaphorina citri]